MFSMLKIKRVQEPTTKIVGEVKRFDEREHGFNRALRGDFGPRVQQERQRFVAKYPLSGALADMTAHLIPTVDGELSPEKAPLPRDPEVITKHIKDLTRFLRADQVGICQIPSYAFYSFDKDGNEVNLDHHYAVVLLVDQDYNTFKSSTGYDFISNSQSFLSYSNSAFISCIIADYIRRLGYSARAHHARDYKVVVPPLLLWAGLGEMSRIGGIVINPFLGPRFKAAVVTTELPLVPDMPIDFGLQEFCRRCKKCAVECPSGSISSEDKVVYNGYEKWKENVDSCAKFRLMNKAGSGCGRCIKVCPWNKPDNWYYRISRWAAARSTLAQKMLIWMDDLLKYENADKRAKWWLDMEKVNGKIVVPEQEMENKGGQVKRGEEE